MRLWSLHPKHLDARGLVALWREALLAQKVLQGKTVGYRSHPQLTRFRECANPVGAIAAYLQVVQEEASRRGYAFDRSKIARVRDVTRIKVKSGQVRYEWEHLRKKVGGRAPKWLLQMGEKPRTHPLFRRVPGKVEEWERNARSAVNC
jgi:hypothetical protein